MKPKVFSIDGDFYAMTIAHRPLHQELTAYFNSIKPAVFTKPVPAVVMYMEMTGDETYAFCCTDLEGKNMGRCLEDVCYKVRPILVPVDKNGVLDRSPQINPNGALVSGGSLYLNDKIVSYQNKSAYVLADDSEIWFGDTTEDADKNIWWVYWDGLLVCMKDILLSKYHTLEQQGLIWNIWGGSEPHVV